MRRILAVAWREFASTAMTKGFIIGAIVVPLIIMAAIPLIVILMIRAKPPAIEGTVALIDGTGALVEPIRARLRPEVLAARQQERIERATAMVTGSAPVPGMDGEQGRRMAQSALPPAPRLTIEPLDPGADVEVEKQPVMRGRPRDGGRLVVAVIDADAIVKPEGQESFGAYQLFVRPRLDESTIDEVRAAIRESIREARIAASGLDAATLTALTTVEARDTKEVTAEGDRASTEELTQILPVGFMILLMISVMAGGQYLLTTTVEEKSNRVVEILLSAVSPLQLMAGKIIGQMGVGLALLLVYSGLGVGALASFALLYLFNPLILIYLVVFFVIAYFLVASLLAAIGASVNDMREAQSLQTPVMMAVIIPYVLWMPISRDPNSVMAFVLSMVPPMSPFVMMVRITSNDPPPTWQVLLSIAIGAASVYGAIWAAGKIFRVGLLMYGKPPNFRTLVKWVRMA